MTNFDPRNPADRARLRELEAKATAGEWVDDGGDYCGYVSLVGRHTLFRPGVNNLQCDHDARLVSIARNSLLPLLDYTDELERENANLRDGLNGAEATIKHYEQERGDWHD